MFFAGLSVLLSYTQSNFTLTLNCTSTGLPPTTVTWSKDGVEISNGGNHTFSQRVIDVNNTVYESTMVIVVDPENDMLGLYRCSVQCYDDIGSQISNASVAVNVTGMVAEL